MFVILSHKGCGVLSLESLQMGCEETPSSWPACGSCGCGLVELGLTGTSPPHSGKAGDDFVAWERKPNSGNSQFSVLGMKTESTSFLHV